ncbi:MAG: primosomal protein N' [bacterium]|nr:primosomal protein N' [bacterium]
MPRTIQVALPLPISKTFYYNCPEELSDHALPGCRAVVPFGHRYLTGIIVDHPEKTPYTEKLRDAIDLPDSMPLLTGEILELTRWISNYYLCSWGEALKAALPVGHLQEGIRQVRLCKEAAIAVTDLNPVEKQIIDILQGGDRSPDYLANKVRVAGLVRILRKLEERGLIAFQENLPLISLNVQFQEMISPGDGKGQDDLFAEAHRLAKKAPRRSDMLKQVALLDRPIPAAELIKASGATRRALNTFIEAGILKCSKVEVKRYPTLEALSIREEAPLPEPNPAQQLAINTVTAAQVGGGYKAFLLYGVTGSGKTLVYQKVIERVLQTGGQALVLIPEISLTPQMMGRFRALFGDRIALQHSAMSTGERIDVWRGIGSGEFDIVIGARSAVFAPLKRLKLIIIDEEGDTSFKQNEPNPRYHARDVALVRAQQQGCTVILGSATPSIETYFNAQRGRYQLLELPERVDGVPMPRIKFVEPPYSLRKVVGLSLQRALEERMMRKEQAILLRNRRGFFTYVFCPNCNHLVRCPHCELTLTYHRSDQVLRCHVCGYQKNPPRNCPECRNELKYTGSGTQRVEDELLQLIPGLAIARLDQDTAGRHKSHPAILKKFARGEQHVLLGTKMVARGHDYPGVTLVGILSADAELTFPDFRCDERTFGLLLQAAGRAGRASKQDQPGEVLIQTWMPGHPVLKLVRNADFRAFYQREIKLRRNLNYPPWGWMVLFLFSGLDQGKASLAATDFVDRAKQVVPGGEWLGPMPAFRAKLKDHFRYQAIFKASIDQRRINSKVHRIMKPWLEEMRSKMPVGVQLTVDVDPISLL